jgi:Sulfotransferase family
VTAAPTEEPVMLFGIGANKAGSSWLYRYLDGHPQARMPRLKELHFFDALAFGRQGVERDRIEGLRAAAAHRLGSAEGARADALRAEIAELDGWRAALGEGTDAAYRNFLLTRAGDARLVGDITPAYALLPEALLARMQALFRRPRFIYVLRDPLDRLWSNLRMNATRLATGAEALRYAALRLFDEWAAGGADPVRRRSDYAGTLARLATAIQPENLRVMFYETLFTDRAIEGLCRFLGLVPHPANFARLVHAGVAVPLDPARAARARAILAPQYDYVRQAIGDLPPRWRENMDG